MLNCCALSGAILLGFSFASHFLISSGLALEGGRTCSIWSIPTYDSRESNCTGNVVHTRWIVTAAEDGGTACTQTHLPNCTSNFGSSFPSQTECIGTCFPVNPTPPNDIASTTPSIHPTTPATHLTAGTTAGTSGPTTSWQSPCSLPLQNLCDFPMLPHQIRYYFNSQMQRCIPFHFFKCPGNGNDFATQAECESVCQHNEYTTPTRQTTPVSRTTPTRRTTTQPRQTTPTASTIGSLTSADSAFTTQVAGTTAAEQILTANSNEYTVPTNGRTTPTSGRTMPTNGRITPTTSRTMPTNGRTSLTMAGVEQVTSTEPVSTMATPHQESTQGATGLYAIISIILGLVALLLALSVAALALVMWRVIRIPCHHKIMEQQQDVVLSTYFKESSRAKDTTWGTHHN